MHLADDSQFVAESLRNFLWVTFTRTNPATDIHGIDEFTADKHWGCRGPLIFDARTKNRTPIAIVGLRDSILVQTDDATMLAHKSQAQKIKDLVKKLAEDKNLKKLV